MKTLYKMLSWLKLGLGGALTLVTGPAVVSILDLSSVED